MKVFSLELAFVDIMDCSASVLSKVKQKAKKEAGMGKKKDPEVKSCRRMRGVDSVIQSDRIIGQDLLQCTDLEKALRGGECV